MESRTRYYSVSEGPQVEVFGNIEGEPTVPIEVHIQGDPLNASQAMVGGDSEGDICREGREGLPKRKRGRPPGNNKTGSVGGVAEDPNLPNISQKTVQKKTSGEAKFPCGVCNLGVGASGILCGACCLWIHNGKIKKCAGLNGTDENQTDTFRCSKCVENDRELDLQLRNETLALSKNTEKDCRGKESNNSNKSSKRTLVDSSPKKDERGDLSTNKKQKLNTELIQDYEDVFETKIFKKCIDCYDDYEAIYDDLSMVNCWLCGLACHGCRNQQKTQEADLYMQSRGNVWVCYECKKEAPILKKKNENWEEETEQPPEKKAGPGKEDDEDEVEFIEDSTKYPEKKKRKLNENENEGKTNENKDKSNSSVDNNASKIRDNNVKGGDTGRNGSGSVPGDLVTQSTSQRINTLKLNLNALRQDSWLLDSHIEFAIEDIENYGEKYGKNNGKTLYLAPSLSHFIRLAPQDDDVESQLNQRDATRKHYIVFFVNDCSGNQGSGEGSHWSLLIYGRDRNAWYHMDSVKGANAPYAKQIMNRVNKYFLNQGSLVNPKTNYVECSCTQQRNGYDCGPLAILFAKNINKKIANGESLNTCMVDEYKTHHVRDRIHTQINNKLWDLEKGEVRTNDTMNHDKDVMVNRKVCWFYNNRECKFGENCLNWHIPDVRQKERDRNRDELSYSRDIGRPVNGRHNSEEERYRYRDRLFDHRDIGRPANGRQNGEKLPHGPRNTDEYTYQNVYNHRSYRDRGSGHQGSRGQQYQQKSYPGEKRNQGKHFLGYQKNQNYGSIPTEAEELYKMLRNYFFKEGPARG